MPTIKFDGAEVTSCLDKDTMLTALSVAKKRGVEVASRKADIPGRFVRYLCDQAGVQPTNNESSDHNNSFQHTMDLKFIHPDSRDELFISLQKGNPGSFRFSSAAEKVVGIEVGDHVRVAVDQQDKELHFYIASVHGNSDGCIRVASCGSQKGFTAPGLAEELNMTHVPSARRFTLDPHPIDFEGTDFYKLTIQKEEDTESEVLRPTTTNKA